MRHLTKRPKPHVNRQFNQCGTRPQRHNKSHKDFKWPQKKRDEKQALEFLKTQNVSSELPKRLKAKQSKRFKVTKKTQNDAKRKKRIKKTHSVKTLPKRYKSEAQDHKEKLNNTKKPQRDFKRLETEYSLKTSPKISKRPKMQNYQRQTEHKDRNITLVSCCLNPGKRKTQGWISQNNNNKKALDHFIL